MEELKNVTMLEEVESKEVKEKLEDLSAKQALFNVLITIFTLGIGAGLYFVINYIGIIVALVIGLLLILLLNYVFSYEKKKLKEIYKIAQHNDLIRHDEMIRARERKRIEQEDKPQIPTQKDIDNTKDRLKIK